MVVTRPRSRNRAARASRRSGSGGGVPRRAYVEAQPGELRLAGRVIGQQVDLADPGHRAHEVGGRLDVLVVVVHAGNDRDADPDGRMHAGERSQVVEDDVVRHARGGLVPGLVHQLQVVEHQARVGGRVAQVGPAAESAGVEGRVHAFGAQQPQHLGHEGRLHERLAARDRDAAAGLIEEDPVAQQRRHQRLRLHALAHALERAGRARPPRRPRRGR